MSTLPFRLPAHPAPALRWSDDGLRFAGVSLEADTGAEAALRARDLTHPVAPASTNRTWEVDRSCHLTAAADIGERLHSTVALGGARIAAVMVEAHNRRTQPALEGAVSHLEAHEHQAPLEEMTQ